MERGRAALESADLILWLGPEGGCGIAPNIIEIEAKSDLVGTRAKSEAAIRVSAVSGTGMAELINHIVERAKKLLPPPDGFALNLRQRDLLGDASQHLHAAARQDDMLIVAEHIRRARLSFDALTGRAHTDDMLDVLFGRFCIGK
jgi:tRNA modification GTPase